MIYIEDIFHAISDTKSLTIFRIIAIKENAVYGIESKDTMGESKVSPKQYYSRISGLLKVDSVEKKSGKYFLTLLGAQVYSVIRTIEDVLNILWKLKAVDALRLSDKLEDEISHIIDDLIDIDEIKEILKKIVIGFSPHSNKQFS